MNNHVITKEECETTIKLVNSETLSEMYEVVGYPLIVDIVKSFGGSTIYLPTYQNFTKIKTDSDIRQDIIKGMEIRAIMKKHKVSEKTVRDRIQKVLRKN